MTAVTPLRRPDELLARMWATSGPMSWPGRAVDPCDSDSVTGRPRWFPRTPDETTMAYRRG